MKNAAKCRGVTIHISFGAKIIDYIKHEWKSSKLCFQFQLCLFPAIENKVFLCSISLLLCLLGDSYILGNKQSYVCFPQKWVSHVMVMV